MSGSRSASKVRIGLGLALVALGLAVFAVRLVHPGPYPMPTGGNLLAGLGALVVGAVLAWPAAPRVPRWIALAASPVVFFFALYSTAAEVEETVSLHATDAAGRPAELRLWIVDRDDGAWVGMPRSKALDHSLDGARLDLLRAGETRCVTPVLHDDRPTAGAIHAMKLEKYAVARAAASIGLYPREARETSVALRLDPCPAG